MEIIVAIFIATISSVLYVNNSPFLENINNKFIDLFFNIRSFEKPSKDIVIVDFDDKTQKSLGYFSRDKLAKVIDNLYDAKASILALDMTFSLPLNDKKLATSFKKCKVISGYIFDFSRNLEIGTVPNNSLIVVEKNKNDEAFLPKAKGIISNTTQLQENSYASGFFSQISDYDGVVRSLPLIVRYKNTLYPTLALEVIRKLWDKKKITIVYDNAGISEMVLDDTVIPTDRFGRLMLNFKGKSKSYRYISAIDIYNGKFKKEDIKNKIVLIGASTSRFYDLRSIPMDITFPAIEIQATAIDNILNHDFLTKPNWIEAVNITIIVMLLIFMLLFSFMGPFKNALLSSVLIFGFLYIAFELFVQYGLILNIIFPLSASFVLYLVLTFLHYVFEARQKEMLSEKLLTQMHERQKIIETEVEQKTDDLQKALEEKNALFRELHHRVKNNLQLILSIIRLQQHNINNKHSMEEFEKLSNRIKSIAKTHVIFCDSEHISNVDMSQYIGELCEEMQSGIGDRSIKIIQNIYASMPLAQAVYVGLIVNELVSNSFKHAFDEDGGEIYIYISKEDNEYLLKIGDSGKEYKQELKKDTTLGLKLVDSLVMNQLDGSMRMLGGKKYRYLIKFAI